VLTGGLSINGTGNGLANSLTGNDGNNALDGGAGDDTLHGGAGLDKLTGGAGSDRFDYDALADGGDTITDFQLSAAGDVLDPSDLLDDIGYAGTDAIADGFVQFAKSGSNTIVSIDIDGSAGLGTASVLTTLINVTLNAADSDNYIL
jgi:Ca2+-binding RTX toxin-like protein